MLVHVGVLAVEILGLEKYFQRAMSLIGWNGGPAATFFVVMVTSLVGWFILLTAVSTLVLRRRRLA